MLSQGEEMQVGFLHNKQQLCYYKYVIFLRTVVDFSFVTVYYY